MRIASVGTAFPKNYYSQEALSANLKQHWAQRHHNLEDDGVVGVRTLLKLNEQLGIDMTGEMARSRLEGDTPSGVLL